MTNHELTEFFPVDPGHLQRLHARLERDAQDGDLLDLAYRTVDSAVGTLLLAATPRGLVRVAFANEGHDNVLLTLSQRSAHGSGSALPAGPGRATIDEYFTGRRHSFDVALDWSLSQGFRRTVLEHLNTDISYGCHGQLRRLGSIVGSPKAVRAVGTACATNRPIVVPCHRVIRSTEPSAPTVVGPWLSARCSTRTAAMTIGKRRVIGSHPLGDIIATPGRGAWMGNRGRLHQGRGTRDIVRNHQHKTWINCALSFRGRRVAQWEPNRYTPLFFPRRA